VRIGPIIAIGIAAWIAPGCSLTRPRYIPIRENLEQEASEVARISPGRSLSEDSAERIISFYLSRHISGCGGIFSLSNEGDHWSALVALGAGGAVCPVPIQLEKANGRISWPGGCGWPPGPTYDSINDLVNATLSQRPR